QHPISQHPISSMFRRRPKNRRKRRDDYILDVKVRADYRQRERMQRITVFLIVVTVFGLGGLAICRLTQFSTRKFLHENPNFAIRQIEVESDGYLTREQIISSTGIQPGQSVFAVDLKEVKRDLELEPLIESAEVARELPSCIR